MKRRNFLKNIAISVPLSWGGVQFSSIAYSQKLARLTNLAEESDRVLVLIQLNGGNDGLSTLTPLDQFDNLAYVRRNLTIPEKSLLKLRKYELGFHPAFEKVEGLFHDHLAGIIQNVGYPNPNKSHFRSTDIWTSGSDSSVVDSSGWLGRYLDIEYPKYPSEYPNDQVTDPLAITVGSLVSNTCQGPVVNMSIPVESLSSFDKLTGGDEGELPSNIYGRELGFVRESIRQTNAYNSVLSNAANSGVNKVSYPSRSENKLAYQLQIVARLISSGLKTKIYVVSLGGFDTHSSQVDESDPSKGKHTQLLNDVSESVHLFMKDLGQQNLQDNVVAMTFSEFGRRIKSNESYGTDHGEAAPMFFFGNQVNPVVFGTNPVIDRNISSRDNLSMEYDFRSVYGSVLEDWFGTPRSVIESVLSFQYEYIPILNRQAVVTHLEQQKVTENLGQNYPNPFSTYTEIPFKSRGGHVNLRLYNQKGELISNLIDRVFSRGDHNFRLDRKNLKTGVYLYELNHLGSSYRKTLIAR